jgi:hypothetical protein
LKHKAVQEYSDELVHTAQQDDDRIKREIEKVKALEQSVRRAVPQNKAHPAVSPAAARSQMELKRFAHTEGWYKKLAKTERSPDARFRGMLRMLGSQKGQEQRQSFRRILRMWHALRDKNKHTNWRLRHARAALAKLESSPREIDAIKAKYQAKLAATKQNAKLQRAKAHEGANKAEATIARLQKKATEGVKAAKAAAEARDDRILDQVLADSEPERLAIADAQFEAVEETTDEELPQEVIHQDEAKKKSATPPAQKLEQPLEEPEQSEAKQTKVKQTKAKQSKAKQNKAKRAPAVEEELVEGPVADAQAEVAAAKVKVLEARAAEKDEEAEQDAIHERVMIAAEASDMSSDEYNTAPEPTAPPAPAEPIIVPANPAMTETQAAMALADQVVAKPKPKSAAKAAKASAKKGAAKAKAKGAAKAAAKVAAQAAKQKAELQKRKTKVAASEAKGKAAAVAIKAKAQVKAKAAAAKAEALEVVNHAKKIKAKIKAKAAAKKSKLKAQTLKRKAKIKAKLDKAKFKMQAKAAKAKAKLDAVKAKAAAKLKLKLAEAAARAKAADEKKAKNALAMKQATLKLKQASADEVARKKARSQKEKTAKAKKTADLKAKLKKRSAKEKIKKNAMKDKTPGALKIKRLARRASRNARELSRKASRSTRRKDRVARKELQRQQQTAQDAIKAQARQAMTVLAKQAQQAGLSGDEANAAMPAELVRLGHPAAMSTKQSQALKAAYAVGAARRAAKMAWMKVISKMDEPAAKRARVAVPDAPSVAAGTAMKALVKALQPAPAKVAGGGAETTLVEPPPVKVAAGAETSLVEQGQGHGLNAMLRLPRDKQWSKWSGTPSRNANALPKIGDKPIVVKKAKASSDEEPTGLEFGLQLPVGLTNGDAKKTAEKMMGEIESRAVKKKTMSKADVHHVEDEVQKLEQHVGKIAKAREKREDGMQEENIAVQKANLKRAELRAYTAKRRAAKERTEEVASGKKMGALLVKSAKKHSSLVEKESAEEVTKAKKWMRDLLKGKSHSVAWGAKLFEPRTRVLSNDDFKKRQRAKKKAIKDALKKKKDKKKAKLKAFKKKQADKKKAEKKAAKARKAKLAKVEQAMLQVGKAKQKLTMAVDMKPKAQGLSRYLARPPVAAGKYPTKKASTKKASSKKAPAKKAPAKKAPAKEEESIFSELASGLSQIANDM